MTKHLLIAAFILIVAGCYREPTNPAQVSQNAESKASTAERVMPKDDIHAGVSALRPVRSSNRARWKSARCV